MKTFSLGAACSSEFKKKTWNQFTARYEGSETDIERSVIGQREHRSQADPGQPVEYAHIHTHKVDAMAQRRSASRRKRPVNLTLSEDLVEEAKRLGHNLSATVEELLADYVVHERKVREKREE